MKTLEIRKNPSGIDLDFDYDSREKKNNPLPPLSVLH